MNKKIKNTLTITSFMFMISFVLFYVFAAILTVSGIYPICDKSAYMIMMIIIGCIAITGLPVLIQNLWEAIKEL